MREELATLRRWQSGGARIAMATVVATSRSAPRPPGATLGLHPNGEVVGSVSGGCVEAAVVEVGTQVLADGTPRRVAYGVSDDEAMAVGLTCGGTIDVFVRAVDTETLDLCGLYELLKADEPVALVTVVEHAGKPGAVGWSGVVTAVDGNLVDNLGDEQLERAGIEEARAMLAQGSTGLRHFGRHGERRGDEVALLVEAFAPRPRMLVFGAIDFAAAVSAVGQFLGYHVTVCDPRPRFATVARFPDADQVVVDWPHRFLATTRVDSRTAVCVLTHDPKFDVPVLKEALATDAGYIGVMGSRRTHADRLDRLRDAGVAQALLDRLRAPIGLDLGGSSPQETAVAIAAELVLERHGGTGHHLKDLDGPIHHSSQMVEPVGTHQRREYRPPAETPVQ